MPRDSEKQPCFIKGCSAWAAPSPDPRSLDAAGYARFFGLTIQAANTRPKNGAMIPFGMP